LLSLLVALRPQQWIKNILILVPLVTSHTVFHLPLAMTALIAFACFCMCASTVYILNDLADISADRKHPAKRRRPFAAGLLSPVRGLMVAGALLLAAFVIAALLLPASFSAALAVYFCAACAYSLKIKRVAVLDVLVLSGLYTLRVLAGGLATGVPVSEWLMAFSVFHFLSLAFVKRYAELERLNRAGECSACGRNYQTTDIPLIESMGPASGYIAVLVLALYINGEQMRSLYANAWPLWLICPVLLYWISRVWLLAKRGQLSEDPVVFAFHDRVSWCLATLVGGLLMAASCLRN
jgi:4-hydroxybenzoate polyprenyltransferase